MNKKSVSSMLECREEEKNATQCEFEISTYIISTRTRQTLRSNNSETDTETNPRTYCDSVQKVQYYTYAGWTGGSTQRGGGATRP